MKRMKRPSNYRDIQPLEDEEGAKKQELILYVEEQDPQLINQRTMTLLLPIENLKEVAQTDEPTPKKVRFIVQVDGNEDIDDHSGDECDMEAEHISDSEENALLDDSPPNLHALSLEDSDQTESYKQR